MRYLLLFVLGFGVALSFAGEERFDYDPLGRLIRVIDEQNRVTEYVYDPAGNLLEVITNGTVTAPTISSVAPDALRRGESKQIVVTGAGLTGVRLSADDPGLRITDVIASATQVRFTLTASSSAILGPQPLTFSNAAGSTTAGVTVNPLLPKAVVTPAPLAIPPDSTARQFTVRLSNPDNISHSFALSVADSTVVSVSPANLTIGAGQTEAQATITGLKAGSTTITLASATLGNTLVPVFVTAEFRGINTSYASLVGVVVEQPPAPKPSQTITPFGAPHLGVVVGSYLYSVSPKAVVAGTGPTDLVLYGKGLDGVSQVSITPGEGVSFGTPTASADGASLTVPITVAADAAMGMRQIVLKAGTQGVPPSRPEADRLLVAPPAPEVTSVDPLFVLPGASAQTLLIRGRHFRNVESIRVTPSTGIVVGATPAINSDGTEISVRLGISPVAPIGPRVVTVTTASGSSSIVAAPENTFTVVDEIKETFTPINAPVVGVIKEVTPTPTSTTYGLMSSHIGVAVGSVITGISPAAESIGETFMMTINGHELQNVTSVEFHPDTGITAGAPTIAADGKSLALEVTLGADAPQTLRAVRVKAGTSVLPPAPAQATQFRVTAPLPLIHSVSPILLQVGQPATTLTVRGKNFQNTQAVKVFPPDGITVGPPTVDATHAEITMSISAAANAALGPRVVVVETLAGATSSAATVENTVTLTDAAGSTYTPLLAPLVGVVLQEPPKPPVETALGPITAPLVGVTLQQEPPPPASQSVFLAGASIGVAVGPAATAMAPAGFIPGTTDGTITVQGVGLAAVVSVGAYPATGLTFGSPTINSDGTQLTVPVNVAADAPVGPRELVLSTATGTVAFTQASASRFHIASGVPSLDSITPILGTQGSVIRLTIRGQHLSHILAVTATPAAGIAFVPNTLTWNAAGTEASVQFVIAADAALGSRVIQVSTPGGTSTAEALPENTFTVYPP